MYLNVIFDHWKKNHKKIVVIITGITLGILAISIGLSFFQDALEFSKEMSGGDSEVSETLVYKPSTNNTKQSFNLLNDIAMFLNNNYEVSIGSILYPIDRNASLSDAPSIVPILYNKDIKWKPNLIYGRYMSTDESLTDQKIAVVGYEIYKQLFNDEKFNSDMKINIFGQNYHIIGVVGRTKRYTPQNYQIQIPYKNYFSMYEEEPDPSSIPIFIKGFDEFNLQNINYDELTLINKPVYKNDIRIPLKLVILIGALILFTTIINESNLFSSWLLSRKKEIAIKKALGATNTMILVETLLDTLLLSAISTILSLIIQCLICNKLNSILYNYELKVTLFNFIVSVGIAIFIALITTLIPYRIILFTDPSNELKK